MLPRSPFVGSVLVLVCYDGFVIWKKFILGNAGGTPSDSLRNGAVVIIDLIPWQNSEMQRSEDLCLTW